MRRLRDPLLRLAYRAGYHVLRAWSYVVRPTQRGVKCVLTRDRQILLVRHTYGEDELWDLPGGGMKRHEAPEEAARREIGEELGIDVEQWTMLGELFARVGGRRDRMWCFTSEIGDRPLELDRAEIAEAEWFTRDRLPAGVSKYVSRIASMGA